MTSGQVESETRSLPCFVKLGNSAYQFVKEGNERVVASNSSWSGRRRRRCLVGSSGDDTTVASTTGSPAPSSGALEWPPDDLDPATMEFRAMVRWGDNETRM